MSELAFLHLLPVARELASAPHEERLRRIRTDHWIGYTRAEEALSALDELIVCPVRTRMPNLILVGATNNGKSMIIEKFFRRHTFGTDGRPMPSPLSTPVLKVQMPSAPDEKRFFGSILAILGIPERAGERLLVRESSALRLMRLAGVRILVIDELHNLLAGQRLQQRRFLNLLRWLGNELCIPIVAAGTVDALRAIQSDDQLANRFAPFALPTWRMGEEYLRLLNTLEALLPLREPSRLAEPALAKKILALGEGILGEFVTVVTGAAAEAITSGEEHIHLGTLDRLRFVPPSERRHAPD